MPFVDWTQLITSPALNMAFSPDGSILYYIQISVTENQTIWQYNIETEEKSEFIIFESNDQLISLEVRGDYISALSENNFDHVWSRTDGSFLGKYSSSLTKSGLSLDGEFLVSVLASDTSKFHVKQRCNQYTNLELVEDIDAGDTLSREGQRENIE